MDESIPREAQAYYKRGVEARRLFRSHGLLEFARTQEIILRHLPAPPCTILDVVNAGRIVRTAIAYVTRVPPAASSSCQEPEFSRNRLLARPSASCHSIRRRTGSGYLFM